MDHDEPRLIYITGRTGDANQGLGAYLKELDPNRIGLSVNNTFLNLDFVEQVSVVKKLITEFDGPTTAIIANSYGAYLVLHALISAPVYQCKVLLLSPALGGLMDKKAMVYARQPSTNKFEQTLNAGAITKPSHLEFHIGEHDGGYDPARVAGLLGADVLNVIPGQGHMLDKTTVAQIVRGFLDKGQYTRKLRRLHSDLNATFS